MEPLVVTLFQSGVWLIPLILLATVAGLFLLVRRFQKTTLNSLKQLRSELRRVQAGRNQLARLAETYSKEDPEPFGSRAAALEAQLEKINAQLVEIERGNVSARERIRNLEANLWRTTLGAPYFWYSLRQEVAGLWDELAAARSSLEAAEEHGAGIARQGWETNRQARAARETQQKVKQQIDQLMAKNVRGDLIELAAQEEQQRRSALNSLPDYFFSEEESAVLEQAGKDSIIAAHTVVSENTPQLEQLLERVQGWEKQQAEAAQAVSDMRQVLNRLDLAFEDSPANLNLAPLEKQFTQFKEIALSLQATLSRMEVSSMAEVSQQAENTRQSALELETQAKTARQQVSELEQVIGELSEGLKQLSNQFAALGTHEIHPIVWEQSRVRLTTVSRQASALGPAKKPRTPQQVEEDLAKAKKLNEQQKELSAHCQQIAQQHAELLALLAGPELDQGLLWTQSARKLVKQVGAYDPENWARADGVQNLEQELVALEEGFKLLVVQEKTVPVPETDIGGRLVNTRELAAFYQRMKARVEKIEARLVQIQEAEKRVHEGLETAQTTLHQVGLLVRSNTFLSEIAAPEFNRLQGSLQQVDQELDQREHGSIDRKVKDASIQIARVEQTGNQWLEQLNRDIEAKVKSLSASVRILGEIGKLDEPAIAEAQRQLASAPALGIGGSATRPRVALKDLVMEFKRRSDYWQACGASQRALEDVEKHVVEVYEEARDYRQFAKDQLNEVEAWLRSNRAWPPTSQSVQQERLELAEFEKGWEALKLQPVKALSLVAQLGSLAGKYHSLAEKTRQVAQRALREQEEIEKLESELDELAQLWQTQWLAYRDNATVTEEIGRIMNTIEQEQDTLQRQYRQGQKNYQQVLQTLQALRKRTRMSQVKIDDSHVIDINGRMIAFR